MILWHKATYNIFTISKFDRDYSMYSRMTTKIFRLGWLFCYSILILADKQILFFFPSQVDDSFSEWLGKLIKGHHAQKNQSLKIHAFVRIKEEICNLAIFPNLFHVQRTWKATIVLSESSMPCDQHERNDLLREHVILCPFWSKTHWRQTFHLKLSNAF